MQDVLLFSLTAMANPTLVGVTTLLLLLPSPKKLMFGYLIGALFTSITLGLVIVFAAKKSGVVQSGKTTINPAIDFAFGAILVGISLLLHSGRDKHYRDRRAERKREKPKKTPRWQQVLSKGDPKIACRRRRRPHASRRLIPRGAHQHRQAELQHRRDSLVGADGERDHARAPRSSADLLRRGAGLDAKGNRAGQGGVQAQWP